MRVFVYTDASVNDVCIGFGAVVVWPDNPEIPPAEGSGVINRYRKDSCWAEMKAAAAGLIFATERGLIAQGDVVTIFSDSELTVQWIEGYPPKGSGPGRAKRKAQMADILAVMNGMAMGFDFRLRAMWIKGHQPVGANRHADFNRRCDRLAAKVTRDAKKATKISKPELESVIREQERIAAEMRQRDLARDAEQRAKFQAKKADKARAKMGPVRGKRYVAFWDRPDWSGGNLRDGGNPFWMLPPAGLTNKDAAAI